MNNQIRLDSRVMLKVGNQSGNRWTYVPTAYGDNYFFITGIPEVGWHKIEENPEPFNGQLVPYDQRYSIHPDGGVMSPH